MIKSKEKAEQKTASEIVGFLGITEYPIVVRHIREYELPTVQCILKPASVIRPPEVSIVENSRKKVEDKIKQLITSCVEAYEDDNATARPMHVTVLHRQTNLIECLGDNWYAIIAVCVQADEYPMPTKKIKQFDFGSALILLKDGRRVARAGWNDKDVWLSEVHKYDKDLHYNSGDGKRYPILPWIGMKTADDTSCRSLLRRPTFSLKIGLK